MKKRQQHQLGKALLRDRQRTARQVNPDGSLRHTQTDDDLYKEYSRTEESDLDAFLNSAKLAMTDFAAQRYDIQVVQKSYHNPFLLTNEEYARKLEEHAENETALKVPRRPSWTEEMTKEELDASEREAFIAWRRGLVELEEEKGLLLTPYEKNLEMWRQLWRVLERSSIVCQIVDARNPLMFRSLDLEMYIREHEARHVLILNKADLLTREQRQEWTRYFTEADIDFLFFSTVPEFQDEGVLDADALLEYLEALTAEPTIVGFVGYPNVGKSSTLNALAKSKKVSVASTPGKTKHFQTIVLTDQVTACDCPGLVFPSFATTKADMILNGILPIDQMREYTAPSDLLADRIPKSTLDLTYGIRIITKDAEGTKIDRKPRGVEILQAFARARGFTRSSQGQPDEHRAARVLLKDYVKGKLLYVSPPPGMDPVEFNAKNPVACVKEAPQPVDAPLEKPKPQQEKSKKHFKGNKRSKQRTNWIAE